MTQHILSLSYGKDSLACLGAIEQLGLPLDRIIHAEVWATDTVPADLPPMVEFKEKADAIIKARWGIEVEHICAERERERSSRMRKCSTENAQRGNSSELLQDSRSPEALGAKTSRHDTRLTYEDIFYRIRRSKKWGDVIYGFPTIRGNWCTDRLKQRALTLSCLPYTSSNGKFFPEAPSHEVLI